MARGAKGFWTDARNQYGALHEADRNTANYVPGVLVVYVHGLMGDRIATWRDLPARVLDQLEIDLDVFSYSYPTSLLQRADIETAAQDLGFVLSNSFQAYQHYLFVTHSAGGLVVKRMLCSASDELIDHLALEPSGLAQVAMKSRRIVNITVPHLGGSQRLTKAGISAYRLFYAVFKPIRMLANTLTFGSLGWGQNKIIGQIRHESPFLRELDHHFQERLAQCDSYSLPRPSTEDIYARGDIAVDVESSALRPGSAIVARGTHGSVKLVTDSQHQLLLSVVCRAVGSFKNATDLAVARLTVIRCLQIDRDLRITGLVGGASFSDKSPSAKLGSQEGGLLWLRDRQRSSSDLSRRQVLTGHAGVGKSSVLRRAAVKSCNEFLRSDDNAELPILIPLHQLTLKLTESERSTLTGKDLWARMAGYWCSFASRLQQDESGVETSTIDFDWLDERMARRPTVVLLDAVDEFLHAHPYLGLDSIGEMLSELEGEYSLNPRLSFVVTVRAIYSKEALTRLAISGRNVFEIAHLSPDQAELRFPGTRSLLDKVQDPGLREFLLTPLILSQLAGQSGIDASDFESRNDIVRAALEALIERSGLTEIAPATRWLDVLGALAWMFFSTFRAEVSLQDLSKSAQELENVWSDHFEQNPKAGAKDMLYALRILCNEDWLQAAARRTIFVQTSNDQIRFVHREWQDHLLGKYLADSIRSRNYAQLAGRAYYYQPYRCASEYLRDFVVTEDFLVEAVEASKNFGPFVLGNTYTMISYPWVQVETKALKYVIASLEGMNDLVRFAIVNGISFRALLNSPTDTLHPSLARQLPVALKTYWGSDAVTENRCLKSTAWCYQKAVAHKIGIPPPNEPWCNLGLSDADLESALWLIAIKQDGAWITFPEQRSTQIAFLALVQLGQVEVQEMLVSTMHYLYPLVAAYSAGVSAHVVDEELRTALAPDSPLGIAVSCFEPVPELRAIWDACLEIYRGNGERTSG